MGENYYQVLWTFLNKNPHVPVLGHEPFNRMKEYQFFGRG